jgi:hypothetical protein
LARAYPQRQETPQLAFAPVSAEVVHTMSLETIVIVVVIVLIVLFVLGYFGRGRMRG